MRNVKLFRIGDVVTWTSQSSSYTKAKTGVVIEVVHHRSRPSDANRPKGAGWGRNGESYVVQVGNKKYWPLVKHLQLKRRCRD